MQNSSYSGGRIATPPGLPLMHAACGEFDEPSSAPSCMTMSPCENGEWLNLQMSLLRSSIQRSKKATGAAVGNWMMISLTAPRLGIHHVVADGAAVHGRAAHAALAVRLLLRPVDAIEIPG